METGDEISQTFDLIEIVKNYKFNDKNQKIQNIKQANSLEDKCNTYKEKFDNLTNEIKKQNLNLIKQARNTKRYSNFSDFSGEIHLGNDSPKKNNNDQNNPFDYDSDKNILESIELKKKQNEAINKIARKMERSLSRRQTIAKLNSKENNDDDDGMEIFNIDINYKKMNEEKGGDSKDLSNANLSKKDSTIFHDMEKRVYIALEGQNQSFIKKYWIFILIFIFIIILVLYFVFFRGGK